MARRLCLKLYRVSVKDNVNVEPVFAALAELCLRYGPVDGSSAAATTGGDGTTGAAGTSAAAGNPDSSQAPFSIQQPSKQRTAGKKKRACAIL